MKGLGKLLVALGLLFGTGAHATLLNYTFTGTMTGGSLDLGSGPVDLTGAGYTITGMTLSDVDIDPSLVIGRYAAMSTYTFDGAGSFITDSTTDEFYIQNCENSVSFNCIVLSGGVDNFAATAIAVSYSWGDDPIAADPNAGGFVLGGPFGPLESAGNGRTLTNSSGHTLVWAPSPGGFITVTAQVAEPASLALLSVGLLGARVSRRRK